MCTFGSDFADKLSFLADYFDHESAYKKNFLLNYYPADSTLELYDIDLKRIFLRRSAYETLERKDIYVGNTIRVYGRQIKITDYADCHTKKVMGNTRQHTFSILKPTVVEKTGEIFNEFQERGFEITNVRMCRLNQQDCLNVYDFLVGTAYLPFIIDHLTSGSVVCVELVGDNAIERFYENLGPVDPIEARKTAPNSLRAIYGKEDVTNGFHGSRDCAGATNCLTIFFPTGDKKAPQSSLSLKNSTCCVIKPHAIKEGKLGYIITSITEKQFKITAMQSLYLRNVNGEEFLEVYKGVVSDFHALLSSFLDGMCVALEVSGKTDDVEDVHGEFRKFVGPNDSEVARQIRPNSLRARFGVDKYRNAVHCTDLKEDTELELEYLFKILS